MKYLTLLLAIGLSLQQATGAPSPDKLNCSNIEDVLDDLGGAQGITTLNDKYKLTTTESDLETRCKDIKEAIKMLKRYNKDCFSSLTEQVLSAILRTRHDLTEARCKVGTAEFKEVVDGQKCIQDNALEAVKEAEKKTILSSQVLLDAGLSDEKLRLRRACCSVLASKKFFLDATKDKCSKFEKLYSQYVDSYTSEAMELICPAAAKLECDKLEPLKLDGVEPRYKFFLNPMIMLVKSLDH